GERSPSWTGQVGQRAQDERTRGDAAEVEIGRHLVAPGGPLQDRHARVGVARITVGSSERARSPRIRYRARGHPRIGPSGKGITPYTGESCRHARPEPLEHHHRPPLRARVIALTALSPIPTAALHAY